MIRFGESQVQELLAKPETGMGYQTVEVTDLEGRIQRGACESCPAVIGSRALDQGD